MRDSLPPFVDSDSRPGTIGAPTLADVVAEARSWIGTPYVHQHRAKGHAVDCAGLIIGVCRELGIVVPDFNVDGYGRIPTGQRLLTECDRFMDRISMETLRPGNVLAMAFPKEPQHIGIVGDYMVGGLSIIHAYGSSDGKGDVREHRLLKGGPMRPIQAYAIPGVH